MAASGSFNTKAYDGRYLNFAWTKTNQNIANNTSTISWTLKGAGTGGVDWYNAGNFKVVIAGETVFFSANRIKLYNGTVVATGTYTFKHNADGSKSFTASAEAGIYEVAVNCTGSSTFTLDTIPRASQPSCITYPEHTQNVGEFGDTISIHMNRVSSAFNHTVRYQYGTKSGTIGTKVGTGIAWTIPLSFMDLLPSGTSGSGTIYVDTYAGETLIGTKSCGFTAKIPASVKPGCTMALEDVTGVDKIYGSPVKGLSKIKVTVTGTPAYSSPIASYSIEANGVRYATQTATTGFLLTSGKSTVTATVKDKRGRTGTASYDMTVLDYAAPSITKLAVHRCNQDGTENSRGEYVKVTFSGKISSMSSKNNALWYIKYKKSSASSYTQVSLSALANVYSVTDHSYIFAADSSSSYDVEVVATDRHSTATRASSASTAFTLLSFGNDGKSIAFGKVAEKNGTVQFNMDVEFLGKLTGTIFDAILPVGSMVFRYDHVDPGTIYPGSTWERLENTLLWATTPGAVVGWVSAQAAKATSGGYAFTQVSVWRRTA